MNKCLFMDYETYSLLDLKEVGLDNYVNDPSTGISMLAYAFDTGEIKQWLPHMSKPPKELIDALRNPNILKISWYASFEFEFTNVVLPRYVGEPLVVPIEQWRDPIILAHNMSLPGKLEQVGTILKLKEQKNSERGKELVKMFCQPVSKGGDMTLFGIAPPLFRTHESHPREFKEYCEYNIQDIRAEREAWYYMLRFPMPEIEWQGWILDQKINRRGMPGRRDLAEKGLRLAEKYLTIQRAKVKALTNLKNINSPAQVKAWAKERGYPWNSLNAKYVDAELADPASKITPELREVLIIRKTCTKSSYKKLERFLQILSKDNRLRYQFRYMGAPRTGRWAGGSEDGGNSFQAQNMARGEKAVKKKLGRALQLLEAEDYDGIVKEFTDVPKNSVTVLELVITLLRSLFQATPGKKLVVSDLNAIENRVLGWAAGCWDILEVFTKSKEEGGDPYLSFGARLFDKTYAQMWADYVAEATDERQLSKPAVLGAGYGLGGGKMIKNEFGDMVRGGLWGYAKNVCGVDMPQELAHKAVKIFRESYPEVVQFWTDLEEAFKQVLTNGGVIKVGEVTWDKIEREWIKHPSPLGCVLTFSRIPMGDGGYTVRMQLPSGRALYYLNATIDAEEKISNKTGRPWTAYTIRYDGIEHSATQDADGATKKKGLKWGRVKTYGGKICENAIQAISRDILLYGMFLAEAMGFEIWGLFHDELATEVKDAWDGLCLEDLIACMAEVAKWARGLLLGAEGFEEQVYRKG